MTTEEKILYFQKTGQVVLSTNSDVQLRLECFKLVAYKLEFQDLDLAISEGEKLFKYITEGHATDTAE